MQRSSWQPQLGCGSRRRPVDMSHALPSLVRARAPRALAPPACFPFLLRPRGPSVIALDLPPPASAQFQTQLELDSNGLLTTDSEPDEPSRPRH